MQVLKDTLFTLTWGSGEHQNTPIMFKTSMTIIPRSAQETSMSHLAVLSKPCCVRIWIWVQTLSEYAPTPLYTISIFRLLSEYFILPKKEVLYLGSFCNQWENRGYLWRILWVNITMEREYINLYFILLNMTIQNSWIPKYFSFTCVYIFDF